MAFGIATFSLAAGPVHYFTGVGPDVPEVWGMFAGAPIAAVAGLLPDIDEPRAMLGRGSWMPRAFGKAIRLLVRVLSLPVMALGYLLRGTLGHRGGTHSLAMSLLFTLVLAFPITLTLGDRGDWIIWTIWLGYMSHLFSDAMTKHGVPFFWPLLDKDRCQHVLPGPLRLTTTTPPSMREAACKRVVNLITLGCIGTFAVALPLHGVIG